MLLWMFIGGFFYHKAPADRPVDRFMLSGSFLMFVLLFLLGWKVFGFVIQ
jgi:hypothetical protein